MDYRLYGGKKMTASDWIIGIGGIVGICLLFWAAIYFFPWGQQTHTSDFPAESNAVCIEKCTQIMKQYRCYEAVPSYTETLAYTYNQDGLQGQKPAKECSCYVGGCKK